MSRSRNARPDRSEAAKKTDKGSDSAGELKREPEHPSSPDDVHRAHDVCDLYYKEVFENTSDAIVVGEVSEDGRVSVLNCNPAWELMTGMSHEEMIGRGMSPASHAAMSSVQTSEGFARCIVSGEVVEIDQEIDTPLGHRWFHTSLIPVTDDKDHVYRIVGVGRDVTPERTAEIERLRHVRFLESMDLANAVMQRTADLEQALSDLLDVLLSIFSCDRAFILYPVDPEAPTWIAVMERNAPGFSGPYEIGVENPMDEGSRANFTSLLDADGPLTYGPGMDVEIPPDFAAEVGFLTAIAMAVRPRGDKPYMFGLHQCSYYREWTEEDRAIFEAIAQRIGDGLSTLLAYRDLEESERRLRLTLANSPDIIAVQDLDLKYTWMSTAAESGPQDVVGRTDEDLLPVGEAHYATTVKQEVLASGRTYREELPSSISGELRWYDTYIEPLRDDEGEVVGVGYYARDVSERKQAEESLKYSEDRYRTMFENSPVGVFRATPEGRLIECNPALTALLGYESSEDAMREVRDIGERVLMYSAARKQSHANEQGAPEFTQHFDRFRRRDGGEFVASLHLREITDARGEAIFFEGIIEDITDRTRAEDALHRVARYTRSVFEASPDPFITVSAEGIIADVNRATEQFTGLSKDRMVGSDLAAYFSDPEQASATLRGAIEQGSVRDLAASMWGPAGETRSVRINATGFDDGSPEAGSSGTRSVLVTVYDVSRIEQAQSRVHDVLVEMIEAISLLIEMRDPATFGHQQRVSALASAMAEYMELDALEIEAVRVGGLIHDVGKLRIPSAILAKPGTFNAEEWRIVRDHPVAGAEVLRGVHTPWPMEQMLAQHHERLDGSGYPRGLRGREIALEARILAVADVVEAMHTDRPDRPAPGIEAALNEIARGRGTLFDQRAVDACLALFRSHGFAFNASVHGASTRKRRASGVV
jgi:PAS domain S-box-containing protein/putative nucleotidyltransferase with HDIG domain